MLTGLDRVLLGGQTERVPAHRVQHVETAQALVARDDVGRGVALGMSDVQPRAARVGEHVEHVVFRPRRIEARLAGIRRVESAAFFPERLPLRLELVERIRFAAFAHAGRIRNTGTQERNRNYSPGHSGRRTEAGIGDPSRAARKQEPRKRAGAQNIVL